MRPLGTNFSDIWMKIQNPSFNEILLKMSPAKWRHLFQASMWELNTWFMLCCVLLLLVTILTPIRQGYFTGTGAIVRLPPLGQLYDCPNASEVILKNISGHNVNLLKIILFPQQSKSQQNDTPYLWDMLYLSLIIHLCLARGSDLTRCGLVVWHISGWILAQVMALFLMVPSYYLSQYWPFFFSETLRHSPEDNFSLNVQDILDKSLKMTNLRSKLHLEQA